MHRIGEDGQQNYRERKGAHLPARISRDAVQRAIDEPRLGLAEESAGDLDIFVDHHLDGDVLAVLPLPGTGAQYGADSGIEPLPPPAR